MRDILLTIKTKVLQNLNGAACKLGTTPSRRSRLRKVGRVRPATDGKEDLQLAVLLLLKIQLLRASIDVGANIVPRVGGVVLVGVRPGVGQIDFASLRADVGESVKHVGELFAWQILRIEVATVNGL
jgi:hypothetical protein